jgi:type VI secretion system secreted protein VgrG
MPCRASAPKCSSTSWTGTSTGRSSSGWHSHNHEGKGAGINQWLTDDAPGQLRTRLATSETEAQLGLGHLIDQNLTSATRGPWRGTGFELRTDGWLAVRAGEGLLISSTARQHATSTQMDVSEAVGQLRAAEQTAQALSDAAAAQGAQPLKANTQQTEFIDGIDPHKDGKYEGAIGGQEAKKAQAGSRTLGEPTERFSKPYIVTEGPDDIGLSTPASTVLFASQNVHATVQEDLHIASGHTYSATTGEAASWFTHSGGIKSIAAAGSHTIQAHTDEMEILADDSVTITSSNDEIHISAKDTIVLKAGQSSVTLKGGDITFACPGTFSVKGAGNAFEGPGSQAASLEGLPSGTLQETPHFIEVKREYYDGSAVQGADVKVRFDDGTIRTAKLDSSGFVHIDGTPAGLAEIEIGEDVRDWAFDEPPEPNWNPAYGKQLTEEQKAALFQLYADEVSS